MQGKTPYEAVQAYLTVLNSALNCVTDQHVRSGPLPNVGDTGLLVLAGGAAVPLRGGRLPLALRVHQWYSIEESPGATTRGRFRVTARTYLYAVEEQDTEREILAFHWHPSEGQHIGLPHLHVEAGSRVREELIGVHVPTERIALEDVLWMLIHQLNVTPRHEEWGANLGQTRRAFIEARSWPRSGTSPP